MQPVCDGDGFDQRHKEETQPDPCRADNQSGVLRRRLRDPKGIQAGQTEFEVGLALGVVLGFLLNNRGLLGWLPIVANLEYSIAMFRFKENEKALKISFIVNMVMYSVFSFCIMNYVGGAANIVVAVTTAVSLIREARKQKPEQDETTVENNL